MLWIEDWYNCYEREYRGIFKNKDWRFLELCMKVFNRISNNTWMSAALCSRDEMPQQFTRSQLTITSCSWIKALETSSSTTFSETALQFARSFSSSAYRALEFLLYTSPREYRKHDDFSVIKTLQINHSSFFLCPLLAIHLISCKTINCLEY